MPTATRDLHGSQTVERQTRTWTAEYRDGRRRYRLDATARWDDQCGNGHNTFGITAELRRDTAGGLYLESCGCLHDDISRRIPELSPYLKWHLCGADGPMHYVANTAHHASDRDHWGLRAGEFRQFKDKTTGLPLWEPDFPRELIRSHAVIPSADAPGPITVRYKPYGRTGEGKTRELDAARRCAVWLDATDDDITAPGLEQRLMDRLPSLMAEFRAAVESLGFTW